MERSLIKQGGGGYTIYLPKKWTDRKQLQAGQKVTVTEQENTLIIEARAQQKKSITIALGDVDKQNLLHLLTHLYRRGFDTITLTNLDTKHAKEVRSITQRLLLGFEITRQNMNSCTIENISEPTNEKHQSMLSRTFLIAQETLTVVTQDIARATYQSADTIEELKTQQDRLTLFCKRILVKEVGKREPLTEWELLTFLMHIQHATYYLYRYCAEHNVNIKKQHRALCSELNSYFTLLSEAYWQRNTTKAHTVFSKGKQFTASFYRALEQSSGRENIALSHLREIARLIGLAGSSVLSTCLEAAILVDDPQHA